MGEEGHLRWLEFDLAYFSVYLSRWLR